jgi:hypothetical protein
MTNAKNPGVRFTKEDVREWLDYADRLASHLNVRCPRIDYDCVESSAEADLALLDLKEWAEERLVELGLWQSINGVISLVTGQASATPPQTLHIEPEARPSRAGSHPDQPPATGETPEADATAALPMLTTATDLARMVELEPKEVSTFLSRYGKDHPNCRRQLEKGASGTKGAKYMYRTSDVIGPLRAFAARQHAKKSAEEERSRNRKNSA